MKDTELKYDTAEKAKEIMDKLYNVAIEWRDELKFTLDMIVMMSDQESAHAAVAYAKQKQAKLR